MFRAWPHAVGWKEDLVHVRYTRQRRPELQASSYVPGRNRVTGMIASPNDVILTGTSEATPVSLVGAHDTSTMNHGHTGIDRIEVSVPAADVHSGIGVWKFRHGRFQHWEQVGHTKVLVWCRRIGNGRLIAGLNFNPSRAMSADPFFLAGVPSTLATLEQVWNLLLNRVVPVDENWRNASVRRLDVTMDFSVGDPARVLEALLHIPRQRAKQLYAHYHPVTTVISSVTISTSKQGWVGGNRQGQRVTIYDKGLESGRDDVACVRWEARCQDWAGRIGSIHTVRDLTAERVANLMVDRWEWSRAGTAIADERSLVDAVLSLDLDATAKRSLVGDAAQRAHGREVNVAPGTRRTRDKRMRDLDAVLSTSGPSTTRLDPDWGREVVVGSSELARPPPETRAEGGNREPRRRKR